MIRDALVVAMLFGTAVAAAGPDAHHKAAPDKFAKAAGEAFAAASEADAKGDLTTALGLYTKAYEISPHPSTAYNIGDVHRRLGKLTVAIKYFETYLALAPDAGDRRDVEALIDKLAHVPGKLLVFTGPASDPNSVDFKSAYILVDGEIKVKPGTASPKAASELGGQLAITVDATGPARHVVEVITPITYGTQQCTAGPGERMPCNVRAKPRIDGRVVLGSNLYGVKVLVEMKGSSLVDQRFELPPGHHKLLARDRGFECGSIVVDVPKNNDVVYLFVSTTDFDGRERCRALDIKRQTLHFEP